MPDENNKNNTSEDPFMEPETRDEDSSDEMDIIKGVFSSDTTEESEQQVFSKNLFSNKKEQEEYEEISDGVEPEQESESSEDESVTDIETFVPPEEEEEPESPVLDKIEALEKDALEKAESKAAEEKENTETEESSVKVVTEDDLNKLFDPSSPGSEPPQVAPHTSEEEQEKDAKPDKTGENNMDEKNGFVKPEVDTVLLTETGIVEINGEENGAQDSPDQSEEPEETVFPQQDVDLDEPFVEDLANGDDAADNTDEDEKEEQPAENEAAGNDADSDDDEYEEIGLDVATESKKEVEEETKQEREDIKDQPDEPEPGPQQELPPPAQETAAPADDEPDEKEKQEEGPAEDDEEAKAHDDVVDNLENVAKVGDMTAVAAGKKGDLLDQTAGLIQDLEPTSGDFMSTQDLERLFSNVNVLIKWAKEMDKKMIELKKLVHQKLGEGKED
jgi:hypothetical protein